MIGSSSIVSSVSRTAARSSAFKDCHCGNTLSTIRSRSFHIQKSEGRKQKAEVPPNNFCLLPSSFKEVLRQHHRAALHFVFRRFDLTAKIGVVGDINRFAEREILIVG